MDNQNQPPKPPGYPEPPNQGPRLRPNERDVRDLKVAQNLVMVASIAGPVSCNRRTGVRHHRAQEAERAVYQVDRCRRASEAT